MRRLRVALLVSVLALIFAIAFPSRKPVAHVFASDLTSPQTVCTATGPHSILGCI
jgi:hypothetical protein